MQLQINTRKYIEEYLKIIDKSGNLIDFKLNKAQRKIYSAIQEQARAGKPIRIIVLKARQLGITTFCQGVMFKETATQNNISSLVVAQDLEASRGIFEKAKLFYEHLPSVLKPELRRSNANELVFNDKTLASNSSIRILTAGNPTSARSKTIQKLHATEVAFWDKAQETMTALMSTVPNNKETMIIIESTANGNNYFRTLWEQAVNGNDFIPIFIGWQEHEEYEEEWIAEEQSELTEHEKEIVKRQGLTLRQLAWRRKKIATDFAGKEEWFNQEYPATPEDAFVSSADTIFDKPKLIKEIGLATKLKDKIGYFTYSKDIVNLETYEIRGIKWVDDIVNGYIKIHEEPIKEESDSQTILRPYVIGGDTAGLGEDYFTAKVVDNKTKRTVATLRIRDIDEDKYADQLYCLGVYYNEALIGIETNFSFAPTKELEKLGYPNMYFRERIDRLTDTITDVMGFHTDRKTKALMVSGLVKAYRDIEMLDPDITTLREMLTFVKQGKDGYSGLDGTHDDLVIALAIAHFIGTQQATEDEIKRIDQSDFIERNFGGYSNRSGNSGKGWLSF